MKINAYSTNKLQTNCYMVENDNKCVIIDPCTNYDVIMKDKELKLVGVFITHGHFDHIDQINSYLNKGLDFYMHENAYSKLKDPEENCSTLTGFKISYNLDCEKVVFVDEGDKLDILGQTIEFLYLPGHTDCSIAILIGEHMFSGDMLFKGGIGRYDLFSSSLNNMKKSIFKLKGLKTNYYVYPGHGAKTNLEFEIKNNQYF